MKQAILLLNQNDSVNNTNPVVTEIINTLGFEVTFEKVSNGKYRTLQEFDPFKTGFISEPRMNHVDFKVWIDDENGDNTKKIYLQSECNCDEFLYNQLFQIYVKDDVEYTSTELSKIYHALSVLESANTDNLRNIVQVIKEHTNV